MLPVSLWFRLFVKIKAKRKEMSCKFGNDLCLHCNYVTTYNLALGVVILQNTCLSVVKILFHFQGMGLWPSKLLELIILRAQHPVENKTNEVI